MNINKGVYTSSYLSNFTIPLKKWHKVQEEYIEIVETDIPYIYTERTNVGLLAAAFYRSKWVALEEYGVTKNRKDDNPYSGRADLYVADAANNFVIEFKKIEVSLTNGVKSTTIKHINTS